MNLDQTKQILAMFSAVYRRAFEGMTPEDAELMAEIWQRKLAPFTYEEVLKVTDGLISESPYMPSLSTVLKELLEIRHPKVSISPAHAWIRVRDAIRDYGLEGLKEAKQRLSPLEIEAIKEVGWTKLCMADKFEMNELKDAFMEVYEKSQRKVIIMLEANPAKIEGLLEVANKLIEKGEK